MRNLHCVLCGQGETYPQGNWLRINISNDVGYLVDRSIVEDRKNMDY